MSVEPREETALDAVVLLGKIASTASLERVFEALPPAGLLSRPSSRPSHSVSGTRNSSPAMSSPKEKAFNEQSALTLSSTFSKCVQDLTYCTNIWEALARVESPSQAPEKKNFRRGRESDVASNDPLSLEEYDDEQVWRVVELLIPFWRTQRQEAENTDETEHCLQGEHSEMDANLPASWKNGKWNEFLCEVVLMVYVKVRHLSV